MPESHTVVGLAAALFTCGCYIPQVWKAWRTRSTGDLSIRMLLALTAGLSLWVCYGFLVEDPVVVGANAISIGFLANLIYLRVSGGKQPAASAAAPPGRAPGSADPN